MPAVQAHRDDPKGSPGGERTEHDRAGDDGLRPDLRGQVAEEIVHRLLPIFVSPDCSMPMLVDPPPAQPATGTFSFRLPASPGAERLESKDTQGSIPSDDFT